MIHTDPQRCHLAYRKRSLRPLVTGAGVPRAMVFAAVAFATACDQPDPTIAGPAAAPVGIGRYVTGEAAARLNAQGQFVLATPSAVDGREIISPERAGELALASVRTWGPSMMKTWETARGGPIDAEQLRVDSQIIFANSPYGAFPQGHHPAYARLHGPYYLVRLNSGSEPALLVSVSAYATEMKIDARGLISRPVQRGGEFVHEVLPADPQKHWFVFPEEAVNRVGRATGARVQTTPELVRLGARHAPSAGVWKLTLDRPIQVKAEARATHMQTREVYVSSQRGAGLLMPAVRAPRSEAAYVLVGTRQNERAERLAIPIRDGVSTEYELVATAEGGL